MSLWIRLLPLFIFYTTQVHAAALDKSGQSITAFLEKNHYAEFSLAQVQADIVGQVPQRPELIAAGLQDFSTSNLVPAYVFAQAAIKLQIHPQISVGFLYDQPFGANVAYEIYSPTQDTPPLEATSFDLQTESLSILFGFQPTQHWNFFTGLNYQNFEADLSLQDQNFSVFDGYQAHFSQDAAIGGIVGISYQIPEYAFRSTLTYRSKVKYQSVIQESIAGKKLEFSREIPTHINTPQSINVDLQTGIMPKTLLYSSIRWVDWSTFSLQPTQFNAVTQYILNLLNMPKNKIYLIDYQNDQWSATLGIARQLSPKWMMSVDSGWDSGTDQPTSTLGPIDSSYHAGLNARYDLNTQTFISIGMKYFWLNPAREPDPSTLNAAEKMMTLTPSGRNDAFAYGFKIGHSF